MGIGCMGDGRSETPKGEWWQARDHQWEEAIGILNLEEQREKVMPGNPRDWGHLQMLEP